METSAENPPQDAAAEEVPAAPAVHRSDLSQAETAVLAFFHEKTRTAGGPKPGYVLRVRSMQPVSEAHGFPLESTLEDLEAKGLLVPNETRERFYLTEASAEMLAENPTRFP